MRITVEIDAAELKRIQRATGERKKSPAISRALAEFLRQRERQQFIERALGGQTEFALTNEELETRDIYEAR